MRQVIGIRREDKNRWERRAPLVPADIKRLSREQGLEFIVQPSPIRTYKDEQYAGAGCELNEDLSRAGVIFAIKEIPLDLLEPEKAYVFFAHVIKGQEHNMPLLQATAGAELHPDRLRARRGRKEPAAGLLRPPGRPGRHDRDALRPRPPPALGGLRLPFQGIKPAYDYPDLDPGQGGPARDGARGPRRLPGSSARW